MKDSRKKKKTTVDLHYRNTRVEVENNVKKKQKTRVYI